MDAFLGTWELDPTHLDYELGQPPKQGTYTIKASAERYLISMSWITPDNQDMQMHYEAIPDGKVYPYTNTPGVDAMSMTRVDDRTLDSAAFKDGVQINYARRKLSEDGLTMTILQSGATPDGGEYRNTAVYKKQE